MIRRALGITLLCMASAACGPRYELSGSVDPNAGCTVVLNGDTVHSPFEMGEVVNVVDAGTRVACGHFGRLGGPALRIAIDFAANSLGPGTYRVVRTSRLGAVQGAAASVFVSVARRGSESSLGIELTQGEVVVRAVAGDSVDLSFSGSGREPILGR